MHRLDVEGDRFEAETLDRAAYEAREQVLRELAAAIGLRELGAAELQAIVYRGHFTHHNHRYEYNPATRHYEQLDVRTEEWQRQLADLERQLLAIGYAEMTLVERNQTINEGAFRYNGYDWVYRYDVDRYEPTDAAVTPDPFPPQTSYTRVTEATPPAVVAVTSEAPAVSAVRTTISSTRGDQPPQTFVDDYSEEVDVVAVPRMQAAPEPAQPAQPEQHTEVPVVEQEPGFGYYPVQPVTEETVRDETAETAETAVENRQVVVDREAAEAQRAELERAHAQWAEAQRAEEEQKRADEEQQQRAEEQRAEEQRRRAEAQRAEDERAEAQRAADERAEAQRAYEQRVEAQRAEAQRAEAQRAEAQRVELQRVEAQRAHEQRAEAQRVEAQRVAAESENRAEPAEEEPEEGDEGADEYEDEEEGVEEGAEEGAEDAE